MKNLSPYSHMDFPVAECLVASDFAWLCTAECCVADILADYLAQL